MIPVLASVAIPRPVRRLFTYLVPPDLVPRCRRGVRVLVPFGRRRLTGYLLAVRSEEPEASLATPLRPVEAVLDPEPVLDETILELTRWASEYYVVSWGEMIRAALPGLTAVTQRAAAITQAGRQALEAGGRALIDTDSPPIARDPLAREILGALEQAAGGLDRPLRLADLRRRVGPRFRPGVLARLGRAGLVDLSEMAGASVPRPKVEEMAVLESEGVPPPLRGARQREILRILAEGGGRRAVPALLKAARGGRAALRSLERRGLVRVETMEASRRPLALDLDGAPAEAPAPTPDQQVAIESIGRMLGVGTFATCLVHGVTGSGKTEIYLRAIERTIASGRRALYLVPEIGLTPLLARTLRARFGDVMALLHSGLSGGERYDEWRRIRDGKVDVVLGARSAVFAPLPRVGLIVVDEEHDASYKQDESPRYHGRDLAILRGQREGAVVVLGSATPSIESFHYATRGRYRLLRLPERIGSAGMPRVERIDMRVEFKDTGRESILSRRLTQALRVRLQRGEQSLILLNRRGYSTFVLCRACGETITCRRCSIGMTLHIRDKRLRCHYCDASRKVPASCPVCGSGHLHFGGTGTERLEDRLKTEFPRARIERMDRDTVRGRGAVETILTRVEQGAIDILVGTQMIAKGHDFPNVTLVGVLAADALLGLPDFRSGERTFQLLSQVAGRSGRGARGGEVIVQAYDADHHAIRHACDHDYQGFAGQELAYRRAMSYPPYSALAIVLVKDRRFERARAGAASVATALRGLGRPGLQILGPSPAPLERLRSEYRVQVLIKASSRRDMQGVLAEMLADLDRRGTRIEDMVIDVDPVSTL
jgi:primosomal protein N' (replication factor Y) (superfamily II helicase)